MKIRFLLIALALLVYAVQAFAQLPILGKLTYENSYDRSIVGNKLEVTGNNLTEQSKFWYALNKGSMHKVIRVSKGSGKLVLELDTLLLDKELNSLEIWFEGTAISSIGTKTIKYFKPKIINARVTQVDVGELKPIFKDSMIFDVKNANPVRIDFSYEKYDDDPSIFGSPANIALHYNLGNGSGWKVDAGLPSSIQTGKLNAGENLISFFVEGKVESKTEINRDLGDAVKVCAFFVDFQLPNSLNKGVCPLTGNINLEPYGKPSGGYFTGNGIVGKSVIFNPYGVEGKIPIQYNFLYQGNNITSSTQNITVEPEYDFSIVGSQIVCKNSPDNYYWISAPDTSNYSYQWMSNDVKLSGNHASVLINWSKVTPSQKVVVTATSKNGCSYKKELIVHVKDTLATKKSFPIFIDLEMKILACSDTSANIYRWIKVQGNVETQLGETSKPYYINAAGAKSGEIYYVETAYNKGFCFTRSYPCSFNNNWNIAKAAFIDLKPSELPVKENIIRCFVDASDICIISDMESRFTLNIVDINGRSIYQESFRNGTKINKNRFLSGLYIITVKSDTKLFVKSLIRL